MMLKDVERAADEIIRRTGTNVVVGLPLGLGKPVPLVNALYRRAQENPALSLKILTALTLEKPHGANPIERAFLEPFVERLYADCPDPDYAVALREDRLPPNVEVCEFFFRPGSLLKSSHAQRHYISSNYTHAARDVAAQGCNVIVQMVAKRIVKGRARYSLSCNPDVTPDLVRRLRALGQKFVTAAVVNKHLPFMMGEAEVTEKFFDIVVDHPRYSHTLFSVPKLPLSTADFAIGLNASALVRDGGTLQVGIGELGDAVVHALLIRHKHNAAYRALLRAGRLLPEQNRLVRDEGGVRPFVHGLFGASEMLVDGFKDLYEAGILKRRVYGFWALQQLINEGRCDPQRLTPEVLDGLESLGVRVIRGEDFDALQHHGLFTDGTRYDQGHIITPGGKRVVANVADPKARRVMGQRCLGRRLRNGILVNASFFLGTQAFYDWLNGLDEAQRAEFQMLGVDKVNRLDHDPKLYQQQRVHARFVNSALLVTLSGEVVSDGLEDGRVVSGVGGQYNFVAMGHKLATGRSILMLPATRTEKGNVTSNIVAHYGHCTIPRHLRDLVVTEYGVANLRSLTDTEVVKALINIADARFQKDLVAQAQRSGKLERGYRIPPVHRDNTPARLERLFAPHAEHFGAFPLGTDFTAKEQVLVKALKGVKAHAERGRLHAFRRAMGVRRIPKHARPYLDRMNLTRPRGVRSRLARRLLVRELRSLGAVET